MRLWSVYAETILKIRRITRRARSSDIVPGRVFDARVNEPMISIVPYRRPVVFSAVE